MRSGGNKGEKEERREGRGKEREYGARRGGKYQPLVKVADNGYLNALRGEVIQNRFRIFVHVPQFTCAVVAPKFVEYLRVYWCDF